MGAVFRCPVWTCTPEQLRALLSASGLALYGAALRDDTVDARRADYTRAAVAIGSEGRGLSPELLALCDLTLKIPMTWDVPVKDDCPACGQTLFKKAGRGYKKPFCVNPQCANFLPEDQRGYPKRKSAEEKAADGQTAENSEAVGDGEKQTAAKAAAKKPAARKTPAAKKPAAKKPAAKKSAAKSSPVGEAVGEDVPAEKTAAKKPAVRKTPAAKKPVAKKPAAKRTTAKKAAE